MHILLSDRHPLLLIYSLTHMPMHKECKQAWEKRECRTSKAGPSLFLYLKQSKALSFKLRNWQSSTTPQQIAAQLVISILQINELMNTRDSCPSIIFPLFFDIKIPQTYVPSFILFFERIFPLFCSLLKKTICGNAPLSL